MAKVKIQPPLTFFIDNVGKQVRCPKCFYGYHRAVGAGAPEEGMEAHLIWLECGYCGTKFYEQAY